MPEEKVHGGTGMKHFSAVRRSDFVNHAAAGCRQKVMQKHLRARRHYAQTAALWRKIADAAVVEASYQPAAEKVRFVKAAFALASSVARRRETGGLVQVLYDSFSQPVLAGIRSAPRPIRQLLYRADPYQIDLQIELRPEGNRLVVTGQLLDISRPELVGRDVQVMLSDGREYIVNTVTNQFGEFHAEVENSGDLELSLLSPGGKPIVVLLRGALARLSGSED
jgi:hypothetical protein